jgi:hypothetical protein
VQVELAIQIMQLLTTLDQQLQLVFYLVVIIIMQVAVAVAVELY